MLGGKTWFIAADACQALKLGDVSKALKSIPSKNKGKTVEGTLGGAQEMLIVDEPGLYRLAFKSKSEKADEFVEWVTVDVIPSIRKTGSYTLPTRKEAPKGLTLEQAKSDHYSQDPTIQMGLEFAKEIDKGTTPQEAFQTALNAANNKVRSTSYVNVTTLTEALNYSEDLTGPNHLTPVLTNQILLKAGLQVRGPVCSSASGWVSTAAGADLSISNPYIDPKGWKPPTPALNWLEAETVEYLQNLTFPDSKDLAATIKEVQERSKLVSVTALTKTLAQHFKLHLQPKNVNKVLRELGLQRTHHYGWEATDFGSEMCEAQPTDDHLRPLLLWDEASLMEYLTGDQYDHHRTASRMFETYSDSVLA